ncbi:sigma-70 family RNA polymerase sigma factor [Streptomyces sp. B1866]|uniref:RNA polymerase sigma factor n=1 Tax=Streptomyces sp. B1866 TaxID=3075431 RepID=UPI002891D794|nr:sigma-70 family RNA polymerase sigma factor [Streptomyces sp. B1866]MDT3396026.1 sigma-70 family RNA polymerase sigma factor [Streptomyces sp. B1866]
MTKHLAGPLRAPAATGGAPAGGDVPGPMPGTGPARPGPPTGEGPPGAAGPPRTGPAGADRAGARPPGGEPGYGESGADALSDEDLALLGAVGDHEAFATLLGRYGPMVRATCLRIVGDPDDAGDAVQETLLRAWRGLAGFRRDARFSTWLYRIAANTALAEARRRGSRPLPAERLPQERESVRSVGDRVTDRLSVQQALALLPPHYRAAVVLRDCCDCEYGEIAEILAVPLNTVRSRISRARQALVALLSSDDEAGDV